MLTFMSVMKYYNMLFCGLVILSWLGICFVLSGGNTIVELEVMSGTVLNMNIPMMLDIYSVVFGMVVITISSCIMLYNGFYMDGELFYDRFCKLVLLFVLSMLFLVVIPNFLGLMIGWDGLGLTSYLLVIYYQDKRSLGSGTLTVLSNRVGDVLFFIGISLISSFSSWGFVDLSMSEISSLLCGIVVVGCMTKSAQVPFSAWLPAAMAAPTPVSALVHSSTLVTAGIYVLFRFSSCITSEWYLFLGIVSTMTMLMSAISAVFESDVKKVVALSTLSQLGVMMLAISVGAISVCFFHLVSHALFKALMFLCVGGIIHFTGIQDLRYLGGFIYSNPIISSWLGVACFSLSGFPFLSGFYSKDLVLESFFSGGLNLILCVLVIFSTCLTVIYSGWLMFSVFFLSNSFSSGLSMVSGLFLSIPCTILGLGALFGGFFLQSIVLDFNTSFEVCGMMKLIPISCVVLGVMGLMLYISILKVGIFNLKVKEYNTNSLTVIEDSLAKMWFLPSVSSDLFSGGVLYWSSSVKEMIEDGYLEYSVGSDGIWLNNMSVSNYYMSGQFDSVGSCFVKGFVFLGVFLFCFSIFSL
uniref:NADH-ubiquinone oxidoreductase chain 5 n=1 Tax=Iridona iridescens TaxID=465791 RepID=I6NJN9_IRIIR|nr:NADH dehydrogenase subunit 5 [Iridona iridescens]AEV94272.1 NADH dehydrogenase subunit 5 [Iridona iridescens]